MNDLFFDWLNENSNHYALNDSSYKKFCQKEKHSSDTKDLDENTKLATYGDAVLKLALCDILFKKAKKLTEKKKAYESDRVLVEIIGKHYNILERLKFDREDDRKPQDYNYKDDKHKYIATAIEACLGAIWIAEYDFKKIRGIVEVWVNLIDDQNNSQ